MAGTNTNSVSLVRLRSPFYDQLMQKCRSNQVIPAAQSCMDSNQRQFYHCCEKDSGTWLWYKGVIVSWMARLCTGTYSKSTNRFLWHKLELFPVI